MSEENNLIKLTYEGPVEEVNNADENEAHVQVPVPLSSNESVEQQNEGELQTEEPKLPELNQDDEIFSDKPHELNNSNDVVKEDKQESSYESEYEEESAATSTKQNNEPVTEKFSLIDSQMDFLIKKQNLLNNPAFLNANINTKIYILSKMLSKNESLKIPNVVFKLNQRRKRDYESNQYDDSVLNDRNPFDNTITSEELGSLYDGYLQEEAKGGREFYPRNSRLFIANLPLNNVTKKILFQIFHIYGKILQINIKNNFGFIQYASSDAVLDAIKYESKRDNFGRKLVLEISNSTARPQYDHGDHGKSSSSTFVSSYKRYKNGELVKPRDNYNNGNEKSLHIIVKHQSDRSTANNLFDYLSRNRGWMISMSFLKPQEELKSAVKHAANEQSNGCVIVKNHQNLDAIVFNKNPNGETVFNEYSNADRRDMIRLFSNNTASYKSPQNHIQQPQFPGMVTSHMPAIQGYPPPVPGMMPQPQFMPSPQNPSHSVMNMGYAQPLPPQQIRIPQQQPLPLPQDNSRLPPQNVDQNSLLSQVQSLPPDVLKNLLANAQHQQSPAPASHTPPAPAENKNNSNDVLKLLNNLTKK